MIANELISFFEKSTTEYNTELKNCIDLNENDILITNSECEKSSLRIFLTKVSLILYFVLDTDFVIKFFFKNLRDIKII